MTFVATILWVVVTGWVANDAARRRRQWFGWAEREGTHVEMTVRELRRSPAREPVTMFAEHEWLPLIHAIDERLQPIARRPVDIRARGPCQEDRYSWGSTAAWPLRRASRS